MVRRFWEGLGWQCPFFGATRLEEQQVERKEYKRKTVIQALGVIFPPSTLTSKREGCCSYCTTIAENCGRVSIFRWYKSET